MGQLIYDLENKLSLKRKLKYKKESQTSFPKFVELMGSAVWVRAYRLSKTARLVANARLISELNREL